MTAPKEIELKLVCDASDLTILREHPRLRGAVGEERDQLNSVYFDTHDGRLREAGYVLRVRGTKDGYVQTAKGAGDGLLERSEWERPVEGPEPDRDALEGTPLAKLLGKNTKPAPMFTVAVERLAYHVEQGASRIEVALDQGLSLIHI